MQSQIIPKYGFKVDFETSHILESSKLSKLLERFNGKTMFLCKSELLNSYCTQVYYWDPPPHFRSLFHQIGTSPVCYDISNEIKISWECDVQFLKNSNVQWKDSHLENSKKFILNFLPNWSILMCWVTYKHKGREHTYL